MLNRDVQLFLACLAKDLREIVRDRRAMLVQCVLPVLMTPLLMFAMAQAAIEAQPGATRPARIALQAPLAFAEHLRSASAALQIVPATAAWMHAAATSAELRQGLRASDMALLVLVDDGAPARVRMLANPGNTHADIAEREVIEAARAWGLARRDRALESAGIAATSAAVTIERPQISNTIERAAALLGWIVPVILTLFSVSAAAVVAADLVAGARERGTRDWAWTLPIDRRLQLASTIVAVALSAMVAATINCVALLGSVAMFAVLGSGASLSSGGLSAVLPVLPALLLAIPCIGLVIGSGATCFASTARSAREAHANLVPLMLVVLALAGIAAWPTSHSGQIYDLVPITGLLLALREGLQTGSVPWFSFVLGALTTLGGAWAGWIMTTTLHEREARTQSPLTRTPSASSALIVVLIACSSLVFASLLLSMLKAPVALMAIVPQLTLAAAVVIATALMRWRWASIGLNLPTDRGWQMLTLIAIPLAPMLSLCVGALQQSFISETTMRSVQESMSDALQQILASGGLPLLIVCVGVVPGICEEVLCRGLLLHGLRARLGVVTAVIVSSLIFAALHGSSARFFPQCALGVALALLTLRCGSILPAIIVHAAHNTLLVVLAYNAKAI